MTTETMNIHKALSELKTLDNRILKTAKSVRFVFPSKHSATNVDGISISDYINEIKSAYQRMNDLISRRSAIKKAVVLSNATTKVVIGGDEMTVAEAIEYKSKVIPILRDILNKMDQDNAAAREIAYEENSVLDDRANDHVKNMFDKSDVKNLSAEMRKERENFIAAQTTEIVDPINIINEMRKLQDKIDTFTIEVDAALSTSNSLTEITISY